MEANDQAAQIAVLQSEISHVKGQMNYWQEAFAERVETLENAVDDLKTTVHNEVGTLKMVDQQLRDAQNYHIMSEEARWDRAEKNWKRLWWSASIFAFVALPTLIQNWQPIWNFIVNRIT